MGKNQQGVIPISRFTYESSVTYGDIDPDRRLSRIGALRIMQEAAAIASQRVGYGLLDTPRTHVAWILTGWRLQMLHRPLWNTPLTVETWPRTMDGLRSDRDFLLYAGGELAARATSRWVLISTDTGHVVRITDDVRAAYPTEDTQVFPTEIATTGRSPADARVTFSYTASRRDIDTNRHVNNLHYLDFAVDALPPETAQDLPDTVEVVFRRQILPGTAIRCLYAPTGDGRHMVEIQSGDPDAPVRHAFIWFYDSQPQPADAQN